MEIYHFLWFFSIITSCSGSSPGFNDEPYLASIPHNLDWMNSIPEETPLSAISIPGTNESLTLDGGELVKCQVWNLKQQLYVGVRYFELHSRNLLPGRIGDSHWVFGKKLDLNEILRDILDFLGHHRNETVLLKVTLHGFNKKNVVDLMNQIINKFGNKIWTKTLAPKMKDARGKIVLLKGERFNIGTENHDSHFFENKKLTNVEEKIKKIKSNLCKNQFVTTGVPASTFEKPKDLAQKVNEQLYNFVEQHKNRSKNHGCLGVISMNFPSAQLIKKITELKPCECGQGEGTGQSGKEGPAPVPTTKSTTSPEPTTRVIIIPSPSHGPTTSPKQKTAITTEPTTSHEPTTRIIMIRRTSPQTTSPEQTAITTEPTTSHDPTTRIIIIRRTSPMTTLPEPTTTITDEPRSSPEPTTTITYEPETSHEPTTSPEPTTTITTEPETSHEPTTSPEPTTAITTEPTSSPEPTTTITAEPETSHEPTTSPEPTTTITAEPETSHEPTTAITTEPTTSHELTTSTEPTTAITTEPTASPQPTTAITTEPTISDEPTTSPEPTTAITAEPTTSPEPTTAITTEPTASPQPTTTIITEPTTSPEPTASHEPTTSAESKKMGPTHYSVLPEPLIDSHPVVPPVTQPKKEHKLDTHWRRRKCFRG